MTRLFVGRFLLPFGIIIGLSGALFAVLAYRQTDVHGGYQSLFQPDFVAFAKFYAETTLITAGVVAVVSFAQSYMQERRGGHLK